MKKRVKLQAAILAVIASSSYADESCLTDVENKESLEVFQCVEAKQNRQQKQMRRQQEKSQLIEQREKKNRAQLADHSDIMYYMNQRIGQLEKENQALRKEMASLQKQLVAQKKVFEEKLTSMHIYRTGSIIKFVDAKGTQHTLDLGDGKIPMKNDEWIAYRPGNNEKDAILYFNLSGSPSFACTLLHEEDDYPQSGFYFATDSDSVMGGKKRINTFALSRTGIASYVINSAAGYHILCVKP